MKRPNSRKTPFVVMLGVAALALTACEPVRPGPVGPWHGFTDWLAHPALPLVQAAPVRP